jgi:hypothetical protein
LDGLTLKMETLHFSKMSVTIYKGTHNIPVYLNLHQHCCENLKSHKEVSDICDKCQ